VTTLAKQLDFPCDALRVARRLADREGLVVLRSDARGALAPGDARFSFVACDPVATSHAWVPEIGERDARGWGGFAAAPRWIGVVPYEAGRDQERAAWTRRPDDRAPPSLARPTWLRYDAVVRVDHASGAVVVEGDDANAIARVEALLRRDTEPPRAFAVEPSDDVEPDAAHVERVREVLRLIARGDVYQVNLARRIPFAFRGDALTAFESIVTRTAAPYGFFADLGDVTVCAASPELALEVRGDRLRTCPIKGTRPRGDDAAADATLARELDADPKERAELTMTIDLHRNDLGRVARSGSVRVLGAPRVVAGRTVWSRVAEVVARRAEGVTDEAIVRAMIPCGSVTGAPKIRAMEIIATLEPYRRGLYTGAFGYVARDGAIVLAMAIRTLEIAGDRAHYWSGGGIVADSDPERELDETRWKAAHLFEHAPKLGRRDPPALTGEKQIDHDEPERPSPIDHHSGPREAR
jgi:anthranilate/para-aminobenzoate synthase component I